MKKPDGVGVLNDGTAGTAAPTSTPRRVHRHIPPVDPPKLYQAMRRAKANRLRERTIVRLAAEGHSQKAIADALSVSHTHVQRTLAIPANRTATLELREHIRQAQLAGALHATEKAWDLVHGTLDAADPKGFDQASRGLQNIERVAASASGELQRVEHAGRVEVAQDNPVDALRVLIGIVTQ